MKPLKHTFFLSISLLFAVQAIAQPDTRRMNISIGVFSPSATSYDYEGAIGVVGSTGYDVDDIVAGEDMFWDDRSRYRVDSVEVIVAGSSATVWVTDLYSAGAPQSGKGTLGKPSPKTGVQPLTENGSNFITEAQEAKIMTDNLNRLDSLGGDGNGIMDALPAGNVDINAASNDLKLTGINAFSLDTGFVVRPTTFGGSRVYFDVNESDYRFLQYPDGFGNGSFGFRAFSNPTNRSFYIGDVENDYSGTAITLFDHTKTVRAEGDYRVGFEVVNLITTIGDFDEENDATLIELDAGGDMTLKTFNNILFAGDGWSFTMPDGAPAANQVLGEGASDDDVLEWVDLPAADGNGIYGGNGTVPDGTVVTLPTEGAEVYFQSNSGIVKIGNTSGDYLEIDNDRNETTLRSDLVNIDAPTAFLGDASGVGNGITIEVDDASNNVKIGSSGFSWGNFAPGVSSINSEGSAQGNIISSGATSLPSSISQISGVDTSQVNVRAAGGIGLKATRTIEFLTDTLLFDDLLIRRSATTGGFLTMNNTDGRWQMSQKGSAGPIEMFGYDTDPNDPIGIFINGSTNTVIIGDRDSDLHGSFLKIDTDGSFDIWSANKNIFKHTAAGLLTIGTEDGGGNDIIIDSDGSDDIESVYIGEARDYFRIIKDDNIEIDKGGLVFEEGQADQYGFELSDDYGNEFRNLYTGLSDGSWGYVYLNDDGAGTYDLVMGDQAGTKSGTKISLSNEDADIVLNANSGTTVSGAAYTYTLPVTTPTAADSMYRVAAWKEGETATFQVFNGANYRTATATGNILPYDDYVEVDPNVTVHLPAPAAAFRGKVFHVIAGGGTGGGNPGTIDVVDGSSTIETGTSLTLDTAFESYSLVCNGSQWIVLNNKP